MQTEVIVQRSGKPGAVFRIKLGEKECPYGLSVYHARKLYAQLGYELSKHEILARIQ